MKRQSLSLTEEDNYYYENDIPREDDISNNDKKQDVNINKSISNDLDYNTKKLLSNDDEKSNKSDDSSSYEIIQQRNYIRTDTDNNNNSNNANENSNNCDSDEKSDDNLESIISKVFMADNEANRKNSNSNKFKNINDVAEDEHQNKEFETINNINSNTNNSVDSEIRNINNPNNNDNDSSVKLNSLQDNDEDDKKELHNKEYIYYYQKAFNNTINSVNKMTDSKIITKTSNADYNNKYKEDDFSKISKLFNLEEAIQSTNKTHINNINDINNQTSKGNNKKSKRKKSKLLTSPRKKSKSKGTKNISSINEDFEEDYEVQTILDKKVVRGEIKYLVFWKGYPRSEATWEPEENLFNCRELVDKFNEDKFLKKKRDKSDSEYKISHNNNNNNYNKKSKKGFGDYNYENLNISNFNQISKIDNTTKPSKYDHDHDIVNNKSYISYNNINDINNNKTQRRKSNSTIKIINPYFPEEETSKDESYSNSKHKNNISKNINKNTLTSNQQSLISLIGNPQSVLKIKSANYIKLNLMKQSKKSNFTFNKVINRNGHLINPSNDDDIQSFQTTSISDNNNSENKSIELYILVECIDQNNEKVEVYVSTLYFKRVFPILLIDFYEKYVKFSDGK